MHNVFPAAAAIGASALLGTAIGFGFDRFSRHTNDLITAFAAGVMLAAAVFGLYVPAMNMLRGAWALILLPASVGGALFLRGVTRLTRGFGDRAARCGSELGFVLAVILHKLPEGMAVGVGANADGARILALGIALQNLPEGIVMIPPLRAMGLSRAQTAAVAVFTGLLNAGGVLIGGAIGSGTLLPIALCFAGGAMMDVILSEMIPNATRSFTGGAWLVGGGFWLMACVDALF